MGDDHDLGIALLGRWLRRSALCPPTRTRPPLCWLAVTKSWHIQVATPTATAAGTHQHRVSFDGHVGHALLAVRCSVPVVPVAATGAHNTAIILYDGAAVARLLRTRRWLRLSRWPLMLSLPWGLTFLPSVPYIPLPARITITVGAPIHFERSGPQAAADDTYVNACAARVEAAVQTLLDDMRAAPGAVTKITSALHSRRLTEREHTGVS